MTKSSGLETFFQLYRQDSNPWPVAITYLLLLTLAEIVTVFVAPQAGIVLNFSIMFLLLVHTALLWEKPIHRLMLPLVLVSLIRIISLSLPLIGIPLPFWYLITSIPLFAAAIVIMRQIDLPWSDLGWGGKQWGWQLPIAASGLLLGYLEYRILQPEPLVNNFTLREIWLPAMILLISTGYLEELIFRRIMQRPAVAQLGVYQGIIYVALFFAVLHIGYRSVTDFLFVLIVGLVFGVLVHLTDNIVGVTLAHGLTNIGLFLIFPFLLSGEQTPLAPLAQSAPAVPGIIIETTMTATTVHTVILETPSPLPSSTMTASAISHTPIAPPTSSDSTSSPTATIIPIITPTTAEITPTATDPPATPTIARITASVALNNVNIRSGPGLEYPVWTVMQPNKQYDVLGQDISGDWAVICCFADNQPGWVSREVITISGDEAMMANLIPPAPQIEISVARLNARTEPHYESNNIVGILLEGERYQLVAQDTTGTWYRICCVDEDEVWVFAESVSVWGDLGNVSVSK